jgi:cysteine desulfurase / selenocysteine lyase
MSLLKNILSDESARLAEFPVAREQIFMAHAGVTILPRRAARAMQEYAEKSCVQHQEFADAYRAVNETRKIAGDLIGAKAAEISLIGPTSLGLSLVANGIPWQAGDEVLCYHDDYPANVYPWLELRRRGVVVRYVEPVNPGEITPELIEKSLSNKTRLVALASCHFLTGYRIDVDAIGRLLHSRGVLFCLDAIQTLGAFETRVEHVDFLSADAHKWLLGPMAAGIFFVKEERQELLRPTLLGAWNVKSPNFVAQDEVVFEQGGRRYEPGVLNMAGILGMRASIELLTEIGIDNVSKRLLALKSHLIARLTPLGFRFVMPTEGPNASGITTAWREGSHAAVEKVFDHLTANRVIVSLRHNRQGKAHLRFSPHFYNTEAEIDRIAGLIASA